ncbi:class I SAM-dependent DNA methyltransferase [Micromonospora avicenniae]|uniref:Methyltransferase domain-containing protein n=1 Tax=Micromonospora avicenniae TaxID=1198245 RepID=A0A1N6YZ35_9ACTN|nr:class I SAM-dependent methyltransferase [Micromonospora avicenniae]SIR19771.1 Methyltransferase domain-containing protein [Micromonospora avicenniae]
MAEPAFLHETRASYDAVATEFAEQFTDELASKPFDRAVLAAFAELVVRDGNGPVADIGCGTGMVTAHLAGLGLDVFGVDLSPGLLALARRNHPGLRFEEGSMTALTLPEGGLAGITAWYSIIHVPDDLLPATFAGFRRALAPGGHLAMVFQVGDEPVVRTEAFGKSISLTFRRRRPEQVAAVLTDAGFELRAQLLREPEPYAGGTETTQQAYLMARRPPLDRPDA